jgi:hypothetical protein
MAEDQNRLLELRYRRTRVDYPTSKLSNMIYGSPGAA